MGNLSEKSSTFPRAAVYLVECNKFRNSPPNRDVYKNLKDGARKIFLCIVFVYLEINHVSAANLDPAELTEIKRHFVRSFSCFMMSAILTEIRFNSISKTDLNLFGFVSRCEVTQGGNSLVSKIIFHNINKAQVRKYDFNHKVFFSSLRIIITLMSISPDEYANISIDVMYTARHRINKGLETSKKCLQQAENVIVLGA